MSDIRGDWDTYFFSIAKVVSARSTCPSRHVGCVIVDPDTQAILSTGYNGAPRGTTHCGPECASRESGKSWKKCNAVHAELNAIISAALNGVSTKGAHAYLTTTPCVFCSRAIINAGIVRVSAMSYYPAEEAMELLAEGGVHLRVIQGITTPQIDYDSFRQEAGLA